MNLLLLANTDSLPPPTVAVSSGATSPTKTSPIPFTIIFSKPVTGLTSSSLTVVNGTASALSTSDSQTFTLTVAPAGQGVVSVTVPANAATADGVGNLASNIAAVTYDSLAPSGHTVAWTTSPINSSNQTAAAFTISSAEVGAAFSYSITSSGGGTAITGSGTISSSTQAVTGLNVSALGDGIVTATVTLTDTAGNTSSAILATVTKAATFNPTSIPGLVVWLDASDAETIVSSGGSVSQWSDKSGNGNNAVQATSGNQPKTGIATLNGLNVISFDNSSRHMTLPSGLLTLPSGPWTYMVVYKDSAGSAIRRILVGELSTVMNHGLFTNTGNAGLNARQSNSAVSNNFTLDTNTHCFAGRRSGTALTAYLDGAAKTATINTAANTTIDVLRIGSPTTTIQGSLCEILMFNQQISVSDFNAAGAALAAKWGFTWTAV